jgi:hypothetical protein
VTTELADVNVTDGSHGSGTPRSSFLILGGAVVLTGACMAVGWWLVHHRDVRLMQGSIYVIGGRWRLHLTVWALPALVLAIAIVRHAVTLARRLRWRTLLAGSFVLAGGWATALALVEGPRAITAPLTAEPDYLHDVPRIKAMGLGAFLRTFSDHVRDGTVGQWTTHVAGHPPLMVTVFVVLASVGFGAAGWAAALCIAVGASAAVSVLSTLRLLAGEEAARRAAPFVAVAPLALWIGTSADAFFAGVAAAGICALAHAGARRGPTSAVLGLLAGLLFGATLFLSYGLVLLAPLMLTVAWIQRRWVPLAVAAVGVALVTGAFAEAGFWWPRGFQVTRVRVMQGPGYYARPAAYFWFTDPAVVAIATGPAVIAGAGMRSRRWQPPGRLLALPAAALAAIAFSIVSNLAKGEVERIYLPFLVWLLPLAALLPARSSPRFLAATCGWTLLIALTTHLYW